MVTLYVTEYERNIIEDIEEIGYGEIFDIHHLFGGPEPSIQIVKHEAFKYLFQALREQGSFNKVIIHGSLPAYGVKEDTTEGGHSCVKKFKFS